jgi:hypothetical protein
MIHGACQALELMRFKAFKPCCGSISAVSKASCLSASNAVPVVLGDKVGKFLQLASEFD